MACLLATISSSFHLQWFTLMWTGCQGISKVAKMAKKRQNGQKYKISSNWLPVGAFDTNGMLAKISSSFHLQWFTMIWTGCQEISKVAKVTKKPPNITRFCQNLLHLALMACLLRFLISIFSEFTLMWTGCQGIPKVSLRLQSGPKGEHDVLLLLLFCFFVSPKNLSWPQCSGIIK